MHDGVGDDDEPIEPIDRLLEAYFSGAMTVAEAASAFAALMDTSPSLAFNILDGGLPLRRLLAALHEMDPERFPPPEGPDPARFADDGLRTLDNAVAHCCSIIEAPELDGAAFHLSYHFVAATQEAAESLRSYLSTRPNAQLRLRSPEEADSDDWQVGGATHARPWTRSALEDAFGWLGKAPVAPGVARLTGYGLSDKGAYGSDAV